MKRQCASANLGRSLVLAIVAVSLSCLGDSPDESAPAALSVTDKVTKPELPEGAVITPLPDPATLAAAVMSQPPLQAGPGVGRLPQTFAVSADGANTHTIPLEVPPGRAGIQPSLSLSYSSRGGNGPVGVGWTLTGLSQVSRCRNDPRLDGSARPVKLDSLDRFCLDGAELVLVQGTYGADGSEYRTEPDTFTKIVAHAAATDACGGGQSDPQHPSPTTWTAYGKDGRILKYGMTCDSLSSGSEATYIDDDSPPQNLLRRLAWHLQRVEDRSGNYMQFKYNNATSRSSKDIEVSIAKIEYGLPTTGNGLAKRYVTFGYEGRTDPLSFFVHGLQMHVSTRLKSITMTAPSETGASMTVRWA